MRRARGHALMLVLAVIATCAATGLVVSRRIERDVAERRDCDRRVQALWLARSAAAARKPGMREVPVGREVARVSVTSQAGKVVAEARIGQAPTARVEAAFGPDGRPIAWTERYGETRPVGAVVAEQQ